MIGAQLVAVEGKEIDQIIIIKEWVNFVALTKWLLKGMGSAIFVSVTIVKDKKEKVESKPEAPSFVYCMNEKGYNQRNNNIVMLECN